MADNKTETAAQTTKKSAGNEYPSRLRRFRAFAGLGRPSFTDWCIAGFTAVLTVAAIYQFIITGSQLDVMRKDQRAWLSVVQKSGTFIAVNTAPSTSMVISNTGKTPAAHVTGNFYVEVVPNGENPRFEAPIMHTTMISGVILPNAPQEINAARRRLKNGSKTGEGEEDPLTETENADLNAGKAWIAVHGSVWYDDTFGVRHWIKFCFWSDAKKPGAYSARGCTAYNDVDNY